MGRGRGPAVVLLLVLSTLWFVGGAPPAHACSCMVEPATEQELHDQADVVVVGRATAVTHGDPADFASPDDYEFAVEYVHKGEVPSVVHLLTPNSDGMCGVSLPIGDLFKVYVDQQDDGSRWLYLCSGTRAATAADLQPLPPPTTPPPTQSPPTEPPPPDTTEPPREPTAPPAETTTVPPETSTSTSVADSTTSTTSGDEDDQEEAAVALDDDSAGGGGGAGWLVGAGGLGLVGAAALVVWRVRRDDGTEAAAISPEPPAAP